MNHRAKLSFLILFVLKEILSAQTALPPFKYDISASLADWIAEIFESVDDSNITKAMKNSFTHRVQELEYNITDDVNVAPFQSKIIFYDTIFEIPYYVWKPRTIPQFTLETWKLSDNKIRLWTKTFGIDMQAEIRTKSDQYYAKFFTQLNLENFVLDAILVSNDPNDVKFSFEFSYKSYSVGGFVEEIKWRKRDFVTGKGEEIAWRKGDLTISKRRKLTSFIKPILPLILHQYMNRNPQYSRGFYQITKTYYQPPKIISADPHFQDHRQQYYYFIPQTRLSVFCLRNVIIKGLLNIESLDVDKKSSFVTHRLLMKNIFGNMTLDYGFENQPPLELDYLIDYLTISVKNGIVHVEARSYTVNRTTGAPLNYRQSAIIIEKIECAVATALMPSKRAWKTCHMESDIDQIEITNATDWKIIKRKYKDWIPFNDEEKSGLMQRIFHATG